MLGRWSLLYPHEYLFDSSIACSTFIVGLKYPIFAASACGLWTFSRIFYTLGYTTGNPSKVRLIFDLHRLLEKSYLWYSLANELPQHPWSICCGGWLVVLILMRFSYPDLYLQAYSLEGLLMWHSSSSKPMPGHKGITYLRPQFSHLTLIRERWRALIAFTQKPRVKIVYKILLWLRQTNNTYFRRNPRYCDVRVVAGVSPVLSFSYYKGMEIVWFVVTDPVRKSILFMISVSLTIELFFWVCGRSFFGGRIWYTPQIWVRTSFST